ncbi:hypothetical protein KDL44_09295 [bacterium]|nr:hypothetical protein [bacterium]
MKGLRYLQEMKTPVVLICTFIVILAMSFLGLRIILANGIQRSEQVQQANGEFLKTLLEVDPNYIITETIHSPGGSTGYVLKSSNLDDWKGITDQLINKLDGLGYYFDPEMKRLSDESDGAVVRMESPDGEWFVHFFYAGIGDVWTIGIYSISGQDEDFGR